MKLLLLLLLATQAAATEIVYSATQKRIDHPPASATQSSLDLEKLEKALPKPRQIKVRSILRGSLIGNPYAPKGYGVEAITVTTTPAIAYSLACYTTTSGPYVLEAGESYFIRQSINQSYEYRMVEFTDKDGLNIYLTCILSEEREIIRYERVK